ncbi:hypothetical protein AH6C_053 [Aeromonas phage pAh6-C]|uniref:Uncharacterized protein n=1 Tax=Aeromonas phage pAh6-C TaxID=1505227 RepID=A0A076G5M8_9CAUD|nr:hypothetical protein AH6C_053 [Aeromonas phage pAh6-C]AII26807.1 hypothetical protein AH6C_053 [Aeromonas phage pAh6-C]
MPYLPTHPRRGLRPGDEVIHVGEGITYRGIRGRVMSVRGSKVNGEVMIMWDHKMTAMKYSIHWCRRMLGVHVNSLRINYEDFNGQKYVSKYLHYAFHKDAVVRGFAITSHATMKHQVDTRERRKEAAAAQVDVMGDYQRA